MGATLELILGGRSLGRFTRGELLDIDAQICCVLEVESDLALAWLRLPAEQKERLNRIVDAVTRYFEVAFALAGKSSRDHRMASALVREFAPDVPPAAIAAALRTSVHSIESNERWLRQVENTGDSGIKWEMEKLRSLISQALEAQPGNANATHLQR